MQISGKITHIGPVATGEGKNGTWNKFQAVITEEGPQYPKSLAFEVFNDKVAVAMDEVCTIHFETKANEYQGKFYTNINAWRKDGPQAATPPPATVAPPMSAPIPPPSTGASLFERQATPPPMAGLPPGEESSLPF